MPLDLTGRRFGKLTVLREGPLLPGAQPRRMWVCRCDCGVETTVPQYRLATTVEARKCHACPACRLARPCVVCGAPFVPASSKQITCSVACRTQRRNEILRRSARNWQLSNSDLVRQHQQRYRERVAADPERKARVTEYKRRWAKGQYADRRAKRAAETPEERTARLAATRSYMRTWLAEMRADPERYAAYRARAQEKRRQERLAGLVRLGAQLTTIRETDND